MKRYKITLAELQSIEFEVIANSEEEAEESIKCGMGWNFDYDDAEIRSLEITLEDCEEVKL